MAVRFIVKFGEHLPDERVSHLKGILLHQGIAIDGADDFAFDVNRERRVQLTGQTLNNWVTEGWVSSWVSEPPLMKVD